MGKGQPRTRLQTSGTHREEGKAEWKVSKSNVMPKNMNENPRR